VEAFLWQANNTKGQSRIIIRPLNYDRKTPYSTTIVGLLMQIKDSMTGQFLIFKRHVIWGIN